MDEAEQRKRIRAARGYAGFNQAALGNELGVSESTVKRFEKELPSEKRKRVALLKQIATACGLPYEFFLVDFNALTGLLLVPTDLTDGDTHWQDILGRLERIETQLAAPDPTVVLRDVSRASTQSLVDQLDNDAPTAPAAPGTRDAEDATPESQPARASGTP